MKTGKIDCCFFIILVFSLYGCKVKESVTDTFTGSYITINESVRDTLIERELPKESVIAEKVLQIRDDADTASIAKNTEGNVIPGSYLYNPNFVFGETSFAYAFCFFDGYRLRLEMHNKQRARVPGLIYERKKEEKETSVSTEKTIVEKYRFGNAFFYWCGVMVTLITAGYSLLKLKKIF